jgi:hypothetical protein
VLDPVHRPKNEDGGGAFFSTSNVDEWRLAMDDLREGTGVAEGVLYAWRPSGNTVL